MHRILAINADSVAAVPERANRRRAQAVMIFDSWGGVLADGAFQSFSAWPTPRACWPSSRPHRTDANGATVRIPRIVFTKGGGLWLQEMARLDCEVLGLDWTVNLGKARAGRWARERSRQGAARQHRPQRAVCPACTHCHRSGACAGQLWQAHTMGHWHRPHPHLQPGPWHQPVHPARARGGAGGSGTQHSRKMRA
jgi:hypothetical protein